MLVMYNAKSSLLLQACRDLLNRTQQFEIIGLAVRVQIRLSTKEFQDPLPNHIFLGVARKKTETLENCVRFFPHT